jgi:hypothetical protein
MKPRTAFSSCVLAAIPLAASLVFAQAGIGRDQTLSAQPKAKTIAELVARYDSSSCAACHQDVHDEWSKSIHARSIFGTGRTAATIDTTIHNGLMEWPFSGVKSPKDVKVEHLMGCAKCHLPQLADATDAVAQEIVTTIETWKTAKDEGDDEQADKAKATLSSLNINCLVCHNRNAITHKWSDGYPAKDTVYGTKDGDHPDPAFPKMKRSPVMTESILCGQCHGLGPNLELQQPTQCATAYASYLMAYVPEGGRETCQACHMEKSKLGHNIQSYRSPVMAQAAVDMRVEASAVVWRDTTSLRPRATVRIDLTNRAGHGIPDG